MARNKKTSKKKGTVTTGPIICSQCGARPAMYNYMGQNLCLDCYERADYLHQIRISRLIDIANHQREEMQRSIGFLPFGPTPPIPNFVPRAPRQNIVMTNFNFSESTVGSLNTGTIKNLDIELTVLRETDQKQLAAEIKELTEAVVNSNEITQQLKDEILAFLSFLTQQANLASDNRNKEIGRALIQQIPTLISTANSIVTLWEKIAPHLSGLFS